MTRRIGSTVLLFALCSVLLPGSALADEVIRNWWRDNRGEPAWAKSCQVKVDSKHGDFKREVRCKGGVGASWRGQWKEEFTEGACKVRLEATPEVFKEEVKCPTD